MEEPEITDVPKLADTNTDPNTLTLKELMIGFVIPRLENLDDKVDRNLRAYTTDLDDFTRWRTRVNTGLAIFGVVITGLVLPIGVAIITSTFNL